MFLIFFLTCSALIKYLNDLSNGNTWTKASLHTFKKKRQNYKKQKLRQKKIN